MNQLLIATRFKDRGEAARPSPLTVAKETIASTLIPQESALLLSFE